LGGIDGDTHYPTIFGTGTEDYFGGAWSFGGDFVGSGGSGGETYLTP
jgi:hypothetical protein